MFIFSFIRAKDQFIIAGVRVYRSASKLSRLFFADDTLIFSKATIEDCQNVLKALRIYRDALGQKVNFEKYSMLFSPNINH